MGLGKTFTSSIVREIGRNYGKAVSNSMLGDKHSTPIRVVGNLGAGTGGKNYKHKLDKLCSTWIVKGPTATFNSAQNIYYAFFELVELAREDDVVDLRETIELMNGFEQAHKELAKIMEALEDMDKKELSEKVDELDNRIFEFFIELNHDFILPEKPSGFFKKKQKKRWELAKGIKDNLQEWVKAYESQKA